jgi:hypothetical protein
MNPSNPKSRPKASTQKERREQVLHFDISASANRRSEDVAVLTIVVAALYLNWNTQDVVVLAMNRIGKLFSLCVIADGRGRK